jgi:hypothetical protein
MYIREIGVLGKLAQGRLGDFGRAVNCMRMWRGSGAQILTLPAVQKPSETPAELKDLKPESLRQ